MQGDIEKILVDRHTIASRIKQVAAQIADDLLALTQPPNPNPNTGPNSQPPSHAHVPITQPDAVSITLVPILTGSIIFVADLMRHLPMYMRMQVLSITSYPGAATTSQGTQLDAALSHVPDDLTGSHVLLIDDIFDSGRTLAMATQMLAQRNPASLMNCVLLRKQRADAIDIPLNYVCFDIPDQFVVGYGLDFNGYYRNLPDIVSLRPEVLQALADKR